HSFESFPLLFSSTTLRPPSSTLFPYTTLFRSSTSPASRRTPPPDAKQPPFACGRRAALQGRAVGFSGGVGGRRGAGLILPAGPRSEEHTSELQSRFDLVCRLLLENKK